MTEAMREARQAIKRRLGEYQATRREAEQIMATLNTLTGEPSGVQLDGMPRGSGVGDPVAAVVAQREALEARYWEKVHSLYAAQARVEDLIEALEPTERQVMRCRYLEGKTWEEVCVAVGYSWRQTHNIHARALDKLAEEELQREAAELVAQLKEDLRK